MEKESGLGMLLFVALTKLGVVVIRQETCMIPLTTHPVCVMTPETVDLRKSLDQNLQTCSFHDKLSLVRCFVLTCGIFF